MVFLLWKISPDTANINLIFDFINFGTTSLIGRIVINNLTDGGTSRGINLWDSTSSNWGMYMATAGEGKSFAGSIACAGYNFNAHAIRLRSNTALSQGLIYETSDEVCKFSVRASDGFGYFKGGVQVDGNITTTGTINGLTPTQMTALGSGGGNITSVGAGLEHTVVLIGDSYISETGGASYGQIKSPSRNYFNTRVSYFSKITKVACGANHTVFLRTDTTVMACGFNNSGQLGDGTSGTNRLNPVYVLSSGTDQNNVGSRLSGISQVACGANHTVFLRTDTTVMACGFNNRGQLGDGTSGTNRLNPVYVLSSGTNQAVSRLSEITQVACGAGNTVFLRSDTFVMSCGDNSNGRGKLGDGTYGSSRLNPVYVLASGTNQAVSRLSGITQVACGVNHTVFLRSDGTVMSCGENNVGQLGNGDSNFNINPVYVLVSGKNQAVSRLSGISQVACGRNHSIFFNNENIFLCGAGSGGQLGNNSIAALLNAVQSVL